MRRALNAAALAFDRHAAGAGHSPLYDGESRHQMQCPKCQHENPPSAKFCHECGAALLRRCPSCQADLTPTMKFCGACGTKIVESSQSRVESPQLPRPFDEHESPFDELRAGSARITTSGERRQLTVLFSDLVGSTALSTQLDPEDYRDLTAGYHRAAAAAVERFGGHVAKYLGDGLLAYFGYPQAHEDDAERAVRAGLALIEAVRALKNPPVSPFAKA